MNPFQRKITDFIDRQEKDSVSDSESCQTTDDIGLHSELFDLNGGVTNDKRNSRK